jgi:hypothetical protein
MELRKREIARNRETESEEDHAESDDPPLKAWPFPQSDFAFSRIFAISHFNAGK